MKNQYEPSMREREMAKSKIFICDDEESILDLLQVVFGELTDFEVATELHSPDAYARLVTEQVDILVVDLSMPQLSGDALIRQIRSGGELDGLYIICMSAERDGREIAMAAGADVFLAKPFQLDDLLAAAQSRRPSR